MRTKEELKSEAIFQALGQASMCWIGGTGSLEFDSTEAVKIGNELIKKLESLAQSQEPKQREVSDAIEFAEWCVRNANPLFPNSNTWKHKGGEYSTQELYDLFKSKTN